jgi:hypothetical protein
MEESTRMKIIKKLRKNEEKKLKSAAITFRSFLSLAFSDKNEMSFVCWALSC